MEMKKKTNFRLSSVFCSQSHFYFSDFHSTPAPSHIQIQFHSHSHLATQKFIKHKNCTWQNMTSRFFIFKIEIFLFLILIFSNFLGTFSNTSHDWNYRKRRMTNELSFYVENTRELSIRGGESGVDSLTLK